MVRDNRRQEADRRSAPAIHILQPSALAVSARLDTFQAQHQRVGFAAYPRSASMIPTIARVNSTMLFAVMAALSGD